MRQHFKRDPSTITCCTPCPVDNQSSQSHSCSLSHSHRDTPKRRTVSTWYRSPRDDLAGNWSRAERSRIERREGERDVWWSTAWSTKMSRGCGNWKSRTQPDRWSWEKRRRHDRDTVRRETSTDTTNALGPASVDTTLIYKPKTSSGIHAKWPRWSLTLRAYLGALSGRTLQPLKFNENADKSVDLQSGNEVIDASPQVILNVFLKEDFGESRDGWVRWGFACTSQTLNSSLSIERWSCNKAFQISRSMQKRTRDAAWIGWTHSSDSTMLSPRTKLKVTNEQECGWEHVRMAVTHRRNCVVIWRWTRTDSKSNHMLTWNVQSKSVSAWNSGWPLVYQTYCPLEMAEGNRNASSKLTWPCNPLVSIWCVTRQVIESLTTSGTVTKSSKFSINEQGSWQRQAEQGQRKTVERKVRTVRDRRYH